MSADRLEARPDCAAKFARLENGKADALSHLADLTRSIEKVANAQKQDHDEMMRAIYGFQSQNVTMQKELSERLALVEASAKSAHHRVDSQALEIGNRFLRVDRKFSALTKTVVGFVLSIGLLLVGIILNHVLGGGGIG
jgi:Mg2+ and Co2+ transporter CorA